MSLIQLGRPLRSRKVRYGWGRWRTAFDYRCPQGHCVTVFCNAFRGRKPEPGVGSIECPQCRFLDNYCPEQGDL